MKFKTAFLPLCLATGLMFVAGCDATDKEKAEPPAAAGIAAPTLTDGPSSVRAGDTSIEQTSSGTVVRAGDVSVTLPN